MKTSIYKIMCMYLCVNTQRHVAFACLRIKFGIGQSNYMRNG